MDTKNLENKIDALNKGLELLIMIELAKKGANRDQVREALGSLDNNKFTKINSIINSKK